MKHSQENKVEFIRAYGHDCKSCQRVGKDSMVTVTTTDRRVLDIYLDIDQVTMLYSDLEKVLDNYYKGVVKEAV